MSDLLSLLIEQGAVSKQNLLYYYLQKLFYLHSHFKKPLLKLLDNYYKSFCISKDLIITNQTKSIKIIEDTYENKNH